MDESSKNGRENPRKADHDSLIFFLPVLDIADISHAKLEDSLSAKVDSILWGILCICGHHYDPFPVSENISEDSFSLIETVCSVFFTFNSK